MACNVFGTPITKEYLRETGEGKDLSQKDRARAAMLLKNADGKDISARAFAERLVPRFGESNVSTMCLIYNATGYPLIFIADYNWYGRICESPYPPIIQNGQWGAFLHGQSWGGTKASKAAVIYSGKNMDGDDCYWIMCFHSTESGSYNEVYTEICKPESYNWDSYLHGKLSSSNGNLVHQNNIYGGLSFGSIGNTKSSIFEAILTLPDALDED
ncbi:unnamed protein product [Amaranthus hypochondriacus]